jgi:flagellar motor switch protein FliN/FliY
MAEPVAADPAAGADQPGAAQVSEVELTEAADRSVRTAGGQIGILLDTAVPVTVCLGEVEAEVRQLLQMGPGSVLRLNKQVGEPVDLYLRGIKFATGHLVVVGEHMGVRIKEVLPAAPE